MKAFFSKFATVIWGVLNGFDRLFFRGTLRNLSYKEGLQHYLWANRIPYKDFDQHSEAVTHDLEEASLQHARQLGRPVDYINSHDVQLEAEAQKIATRDGIDRGLICVFRRVEPCLSFQIHKNRASKKLEITYRSRQCLHLYHYQIHPVFGFMHARIQTWFPFAVYICLNGRAWLARQLDQAGIAYQRRDNGFTWLQDVAQAQALADQQLQANWPSLLGQLAKDLNPIHDTLFAHYPTQYYWSLAQSEWASDVLFHSRADLEALYPRWIQHAVTTYGAVDILRFLGRKIPLQGQVPASFTGEVETNLKDREEGVRIKHWLNHNSLKLYDKGSVLRVECTLNDPTDFRVYRPKEGDPEGAKAWRPLRYGIADLHRRATVCQAANERYLEALAAVQETTPLRQLVEPLCRPVVEATATPHASAAAATPHASAAVATATATATAAGLAPATPAVAEQAKPVRTRRLRALNPLAAADAALLEAVSRHEFLINGLRNRDLRRLLYPIETTEPKEQRRRSAAVGRQLRLLRAHGLLQKVQKTHRYLVTANGRKVITALLAARDANADLLTTIAA
jgi:hypothetical protein